MFVFPLPKPSVLMADCALLSCLSVRTVACIGGNEIHQTKRNDKGFSTSLALILPQSGSRIGFAKDEDKEFTHSICDLGMMSAKHPSF